MIEMVNISRDNKKVVVLTDEAENVKFRLTDSVDIARDGMVYFGDASYKYNLSEFTLEILEGNPHGRLLSYDPRTRKTRVLVRDLYFANGVAVSKDQYSVVFCETVMYVNSFHTLAILAMTKLIRNNEWYYYHQDEV